MRMLFVIAVVGICIGSVLGETKPTEASEIARLTAEIVRMKSENDRLKAELEIKDKEIAKLIKIIDSTKPVLDGPRIVGYDGIPFGASISRVPDFLAKLSGVSQINGRPDFKKVPTKTYYRYYIDRKHFNGETEQSQVSVYFQNGKAAQLREVFGGCVDSKEAKSQYEFLLEQLESRWGEPSYSLESRTNWVQNDSTAVLRWDPPSNPHAFPILTVTVWKTH